MRSISPPTATPKNFDSPHSLLGPILGIIALTSMISFPRSFAAIKLFLIALFIAVNILNSFTINRHQRTVAMLPVAVFYVVVALLGTIWIFIGASNGAHEGAASDYFRLYVVWSAAYFLLLIALRQFDAAQIFHRSIVISGIIIALVNFIGLYDYYSGARIIPSWMYDELELRVGFHEGYTQVTSHNIGFLLFIGGYLIAWHCRAMKQRSFFRIESISLILTIAIIIFSGRRAIWIAVSVTPIIILVLSALTQTFSQNRNFGKMVIVGILIAALIGATTPFDLILQFIYSAFSSEDERTIQSAYLIDGFVNYPYFGSGLGVDAGYLRSDNFPWLYELTYHQLFYNFGTFGVLIILVTAFLYIRKAADIIATPKFYRSGFFELLVGFFIFCIGAYSNPYFGSFDFLLVIAILPFIASYDPIKER